MIAAAWMTCSQDASAERLPIKVYTTVDGLANNVVNRIVPDSRGFLWFCTREGLSRFDGRDFVNFTVADGLPSGVINDLVESPNGLYWIATGNGLVRFDPRGVLGPTATEGSRPAFVTHTPGLDFRSRHITSLLARPDGALWVGTMRGLFRLVDGNSAPTAFQSVDLPEPALEISAIAQDGGGTVWVGTGRGLYRYREASVGRLTSNEGLPGDVVRAIHIDGSGLVWVGTTTGGLVVVSGQAADGAALVQRRYSTADGLPTNWVQQIVGLADGRIWAATSGGLVRIDGNPRTGVAFQVYGTEHGLPFQTAIAVAEDRNRNLWVGTTLGIAKLLADGFTIFNGQDGLPTAGTLLATRMGEVLVMDAGGVWRVSRYDGAKFISTTLPLSTLQPSWGWNQMLLIDRDGDWWVGSRSGVWRYGGPTTLEALPRLRPKARYSRTSGLAADVIIRLFEDSHGNVWIASVGEGQPNGLSRWERRTDTFRHYSEADGLPALDQFYASSFAEDRHGQIWIGFSGDGGLVRLRGEQLDRFGGGNGIPGGAIRNITIDAKDRLWAASYRGGLIRVDRLVDTVPVVKVYTTRDGLSSNEVSAVVEDLAGRVFAGTARGLDRLDPDTGRVRTYRAGEGPLHGETQAALRDGSGALWFSYLSGVVRLVPALDREAFPPRALITGVRIAGRPVPLSAVGETAVSRQTIPPGENAVEIDFAAPGFGPRESVTYQFALGGADDDWSPGTEQRTLSYATLAPGRYQFRVRAVDAAGVASEPATFAFEVLPVLWRRWWFLTLMVLTVAACAWALYRYRVTRLLELGNVRTRIAGDLHDDIGANLTRIAVLSEVVRRQLGPATPAGDQLHAIANVARESVTSMGDIVWAVSPERDTIGELVRKIREHASETFADGDVELTFTPPEHGQTVRLGGERRRDIYLIAKEAITNAARHSGATRVSVQLGLEYNGLRLLVTDNGKGFDRGAHRDGHGLASMTRRAQRLGGILEVRSVPGHGTTIGLTVPAATRFRTAPQNR